MSRTTACYDELIDALREAALLSSCGSVLGWDEQTYLPPGGTEHRSRQLSLLAGLVHDLATAPRIGELLAELEASGELGPDDGATAVNVREARREYDRAVRLPRELVEELSRVTTLAQQAWVAARKDDDFAAFLPWLEQVVNLKRQEAAAIGVPQDGIPYDALLDYYEPGASSAWVQSLFDPLRAALVPLLAAIRDSGVVPPVEILRRHYPIESQRRFGIEVARRIGFSFDNGRLDEAAHPFCSGFGPGDCRLTTRYDDHHFPGAFFGTLHEAGHGIYEQGLDGDAFGTAMGQHVSLGIHESQSRMWENFVGRSRAFWDFCFEPAREAFPEALRDVSVDQFHAAVNDVRPSFIRVEADEVTYNLHIMMRFELEQKLIGGELEPADVPTAWNEVFTRDFGITPAGDADGCLQDIHWSGGGIGYFPTYALGNMYAAEFFSAAGEALGDLDDQFRRGEFGELKRWLNEQIHVRGRQFRAGRLVELVTEKPLSHEALVEHLERKFGLLYGL